MNRFARVAAVASVLALAPMLAGCETFDPTDIFSSDMFDTKKKLPGERKAVFPEGTPGVSQGVPQELVKGYQRDRAGAAAGRRRAGREAEAETEAQAEGGGQAAARRGAAAGVGDGAAVAAAMSRPAAATAATAGGRRMARQPAVAGPGRLA